MSVPRRVMALSLAAGLFGAIGISRAGRGIAAESLSPDHGAVAGGGSEHDFDFLLGRWQVKHRRLKGGQTWETNWIMDHVKIPRS